MVRAFIFGSELALLGMFHQVRFMYSHRATRTMSDRTTFTSAPGRGVPVRPAAASGWLTIKRLSEVLPAKSSVVLHRPREDFR